MNQTTLLHRQAMDLMDEAERNIKDGDLEAAAHARKAAFDLEAQAANSLKTDEGAEPSRSILYRSAASIALQCGLNSDAERLIHQGLSGEPPESIAEDLRNLLEDVSFQRHLALRGVELSNTEIQVSLEGNEIGYGIAPTAEVVPRIEGTNTLLYRTAERMARSEYRESGPPTHEIRDVAQSFMSLPRAASYAFSIRVGRLQQMAFQDPSEEVVNELLDCLTLLDTNNPEGLRQRIGDPAYYNNFVALAQTILPDGKMVKTVGFTVQRSGQSRELALRHTANEIKDNFKPELSPSTKQVSKGKERNVVVSGQLRLADSLHQANKIRILSDNGRSTTVHVPDGMMTDIVKPLWEAWVTIEGIKMGRSITLNNIRRKMPDIE